MATLGNALMNAAGNLWRPVARRLRHPAGAEDAQRALAVCSLLLKLVCHLQQHRGMSIALLSGEAGYQPKIDAKRSEIKTILADMADRAAHGAGEPGFSARDIAELDLKWQSFTTGMEDLSPDLSLAQHGQMIARVQDWLEAYGAAHLDAMAGSHLPPGAARSYYYGLPALTETLGQARAIGMGVAVRGSYAPGARVRLLFLTTHAESLLQWSASVCNPGEKGQAALVAVQELLKVIRYEMVANCGVMIGADCYYQLATAAIDKVFLWIEERGAELEALWHSAVQKAMAHTVYRPFRRAGELP